MADRHDYVALEWVKGEIGETLKQARQALEAFVENPNDPSSMSQCLDFVHQVHGSLQIVEFYGAALLAEEMENLTEALRDGQVANQAEALEVLMQAILQLPVYLERVQSARRDLPLVVLPLLNDLRSARGEGLLSETHLFNPPLQHVALLDDSTLAARTQPNLAPLLRKMRQMYQTALVGLLRDQNLETNLGYLNKVFTRLEELTTNAPMGSLWQVCNALVEGVRAGNVANSPTLRSLFRSTDKEFKRLLEQGVAAINQPAPEELLKSLLFYVAKSDAQTPRILQVKEKFGLAEAMPDSDLVDEERARLAGPDRDAMRSVIAALCEELVRVKDSLDLFVRSDRSQVSDLDGLPGPLKQIADTLAVLGFGLPRKVILDQLSTVKSLAEGQREPDDNVLMDVAGALLYVEATLSGMVGPSDGAHGEDSHLPTTDLTQIHQLVIRESRVGLQQAKDAIIEFIDSQWDYQHLERVPALLNQVRGGLAMIPLARAAELLGGCNHYIEQQLLADRTPPKWHQLDTLADVITGIEYYLERLAEDPTTQGDMILDLASQSLTELGWQGPHDAVEEQSAAEVDNLPLLEPTAGQDPEGVAPAELELLSGVEEPAEGELGEAVTPAAEALHDAPSEELPTHLQDEAVPAEEVEVSASADDLPTLTEVMEPPLSLAEVLAQPVSEVNPPARNVPASLLPPPADEEPVDDELREVFIEEAEEVLETIDTYLPKWLADPENKSALTELRRAFHTLKGSGRMVRALVIGELSWSVENLLNRVIEHSVQSSPAVLRVVRDVREALPTLVGEFASNEQRQHDSVDILAARAHALARGEVFEQGDATDEPAEAVPATLPFAELADLDLASLAGPEVIQESVSEAEVEHEAEAAPSVEAEPAPEAIDESIESLDPQLLDIFRNESETHLDNLNAFIKACDEQLPQPVTDDLQRALHTLKGSAYMAGIVPIAELSTPLERLVKEFKANLIPMDMLESEVLKSAEKMFRVGLAQLETHPLRPIPGAAELIERVIALQAERLDVAQLARREGDGLKRDPQLISSFLSAGMDILLDAEGLLGHWQENPDENQDLKALLDELTILGTSAQMADLPQIDELCEALLDVYGAVEEGRLAVDKGFFNEVELGHEALISMMDQVAAGLEVSPQTERVEALRALLDKAIDPEASGVVKVEEDGSFSLSELPGVEALPEVEEPVAFDALPELGELSSEMSDEELFGSFDLSEVTLDGEPELPLPELDADAVLGADVAHASEEPAAEEEEDWLQALDEPGFELAPELTLELPEQPLVVLPEAVAPSADVGAEAASNPTAPAPVATSASAPATLPLPDDLDDEIVAIFLEEGVDILESAGHALQRWLDDPENHPSLLSLQRDLHTLKGGARMAEIRPIGDLAHELETLYEGLVDRRYSHTPEIAGLLQASHDQLAVMLEQLQRKQALNDPADLINAIRSFRQGGNAAPAGEQDIVATRLDLLEADSEPVVPAISAESTPAVQDEALLPQASPLEDDFEALMQSLDEQPAEPTPEAVAPEEPAVPEQLPEEPQAEVLSQADSARPAEAEANEVAEPLAESEPELEFEPVDIDEVPAEAAPAPAPFVASAGDDERDPELLEIFLEEGFDIMDSFGAALQRWHDDLNNGLEVETLLRDLHTLKGGARMVEVAQIGDLTHELEFLYEAFGAGTIQPTETHFSLLQRSQDLLHEMLDALRANAPIPSSDVLVEAVRAAVRQQPFELPAGLAAPVDAAADSPSVSQEPSEPGIAPAAEAASEPVLGEESVIADELPLSDAPLLTAAEGDEHIPAPHIVLPFVLRAAQAAANAAAQRPPQEMVKVPAELLEGLVNLAGETSIFRGRVEQQVSDGRTALTEMETTIERMRDQLRRLDTETQAQILSGYQVDTEREGNEDFDPLEMDRHSQLQQLSRALFESASDLLDLKETLAGRNRDAETLLLQQARVNTELQEGLMRTRMVPFERMLPRLRRIVRQVAGELGKQVELQVGNADGEMDRTVLERIVPPLEHMLRNAVDHGLETAEARRAAGKPEKGVIRLNLAREGGDIVINLSDDGAGISLEAVRRKAIERGMMRADADLSDAEILHFILEAGFSTADKVTQISGRGVGMDVVLSEVKQLGGSMSIDSKPGEGTHFQIRLPFTVSVNRALMVLSGEDLYAIPLNTIEGIVRVSPFELEDYYQPDAPRYEYAGQDYELRYLGELLSNGQQPKLIGQSLPLPVILVRSHDHSVAVQVDALAGSREIVVKSLGAQFASVPGISGATILGDGRVVVILDLIAHLRGMHTREQNVQQHHEDARQGLAEVEQVKPLLVMVVDDSVTVRKVTTRLLERAGMNVITAKDGVDAIALLQEHTPDILLLDIEMPRMDGFEVATLIRHDAHLKHLPIIMITSRTGTKHRERAVAIGVNEYLGKPYQESLLLDTIELLAKPHG